jgi:hypothetical protein
MNRRGTGGDEDFFPVQLDLPVPGPTSAPSSNSADLFGLQDVERAAKIEDDHPGVSQVCNSPWINPAFTSRAPQIKESVPL